MTSDPQTPVRTLHGGYAHAYPHQDTIVIEEMGMGRASRIHLDRDSAAALAQQIDLALLTTPKPRTGTKPWHPLTTPTSPTESQPSTTPSANSAKNETN